MFKLRYQGKLTVYEYNYKKQDYRSVGLSKAKHEFGGEDALNEALQSGEAKRIIDDDGDELITWKEGKIGTRSGWKGEYALKGQKR